MQSTDGSASGDHRVTGASGSAAEAGDAPERRRGRRRGRTTRARGLTLRDIFAGLLAGLGGEGSEEEGSDTEQDGHE